MKKILISTVSIVGSFVLLGSVAQAQISNTGPGSNNTITNSSSSNCSSTSTNSAEVQNQNTQTSTSGTASQTGNGSTGSATSGSTSNSNQTNTQVTQSNGNSCVPGQTTGQTTTPGVGQGGSVLGAEVAATTQGQGAGIAALPATGGNSPLESVLRVIALTSGVVAVLAVARTFSQQF